MSQWTEAHDRAMARAKADAEAKAAEAARAAVRVKVDDPKTRCRDLMRARRTLVADMLSWGSTHEQIAEVTGQTVGAVASMAKKLRKTGLAPTGLRRELSVVRSARPVWHRLAEAGVLPIVTRVADEHDLDIEKILGRTNVSHVIVARDEAIVLVQDTLALSNAATGRLFGRDHSTIGDARLRWEKRVRDALSLDERRREVA